MAWAVNVRTIDAPFAQHPDVLTSTIERYSLLFMLSNKLLAIVARPTSFVDGRGTGCPDAARHVDTAVFRISSSPYS